MPDKEAFTGAYTEFITFLRSKYPDAHIYAIVGPCITYDKLPAIKAWLGEMIEQRKAAEDRRIHMLELPMQDGSLGYGADWHPNVKQHESSAQVLTQRLREDLGW